MERQLGHDAAEPRAFVIQGTVVDSSVWIDHFRSRRTAQTARLAEELNAHWADVIVPGLVLVEVLAGLDGRELDRVQALLCGLSAAPNLDLADYMAAVDLSRRCRRAGRTVSGAVDCLIAQLCLRYEYALLSSDRGFRSIAAVAPLRLLT